MSSFLLCLQMIPWKKVFGNIGLFTTFFTLTMVYLSTSSFTSVWTSMMVSFGIASAFTVGCLISEKVRQAVLVTIIMCFSAPGLAVIFFFGSWITISIVVGDFLANLRLIQPLVLCVACIPADVNANYTIISGDISWHISLLESFGSIIHYSFFIPFALLFVHAFVYSCAFPVFFKNQNPAGHTRYDSKGVEFKKILISKVYNGLMLLVGLVFGVTITLFYFQHLFALTLKEESVGPSHSCFRVPSLTKSWVIIGYLGTSGVLLVLAQFSGYVYELRDNLLNNYNNDSENKNADENLGRRRRGNVTPNDQNALPLQTINRTEVKTEPRAVNQAHCVNASTGSMLSLDDLDF